MIKITEKENNEIKTLLENRNYLDDLITIQLQKKQPVRNKELMAHILGEYIKYSRLIDEWWEKMGKKYDFNPQEPYSVDFKSKVIKESG